MKKKTNEKSAKARGMHSCASAKRDNVSREDAETRRVLRVGTLFSGIGAAEQALKQLNVPYEIVFACDNGERKLKLSKEEILAQVDGMSTDEVERHVEGLYEATGKPNLVKKSYLANYDIQRDCWHEDVRFMSGDKYKGNVDILIGGSPCQSFSTYGLKRGLEDARGTLFYEYARMVKEVQPSVFIYENVRGLLCHDKGRTWQTIKGIFDCLDYDIGEPQVLDAQKYGLPQMRKRLFVVGIKKSLPAHHFVYPKPVPLVKKVVDYLNAAESIPIEYYLPEKGYKWTTEVERNQNKARMNREVMGCQTAVQQYNWSGDFRMEIARPDHIASSRVFVTTYQGPDERLRKEFGHKKVVVRKLMPEECLRLMGFEDFKIVVDDNTAYRQSGNSIAVPVMKALLREILSQVFEKEVCHG